MAKPLTIDRFEGEDKEIAVLVDEDGECQNVPRSKLPAEAKAGDVLTESFEIDAEATKALKQETKELQEELKKTDPGGDLQI